MSKSVGGIGSVFGVRARNVFGAVLSALALSALMFAGYGGKVSSAPPATATFADGRDGKTYRSVTIGAQTWMAENLNYEAENSKCYNDSPDSCAKYGRLYDWNTAMGGAPESFKVPSGVQGVCPAGWHVPSRKEWMTLVDKPLGKKLKSTSGWSAHTSNGTDDYGFAALPGGAYNGAEFINGGNIGLWWATNEAPDAKANSWTLERTSGFRDNYKSLYLSVRCLKD